MKAEVRTEGVVQRLADNAQLLQDVLANDHASRPTRHLYVDPRLNRDNNGRYRTIMRALGDAHTGDIIEVEPGTYTAAAAKSGVIVQGRGPVFVQNLLVSTQTAVPAGTNPAIFQNLVFLGGAAGAAGLQTPAQLAIMVPTVFDNCQFSLSSPIQIQADVSFRNCYFKLQNAALKFFLFDVVRGELSNENCKLEICNSAANASGNLYLIESIAARAVVVNSQFKIYSTVPITASIGAGAVSNLILHGNLLIAEGAPGSSWSSTVQPAIPPPLTNASADWIPQGPAKLIGNDALNVHLLPAQNWPAARLASMSGSSSFKTRIVNSSTQLSANDSFVQISAPHTLQTTLPVLYSNTASEQMLILLNDSPVPQIIRAAPGSSYRGPASMRAQQTIMLRSYGSEWRCFMSS